MKRILSVLIVAVFLLGMMPTLAFAETATSGTTGDCTWSLNGTELIISGNGAMGSYSPFPNLPWGDAVTSVEIEEGVTSIGSWAFAECNFVSITIPSTVTSIGECAFYHCFFDRVYISDLSAWLKIAFNYYENPLNTGADLYINKNIVTNLTIPSTVTSIGEYAFFGCESLTSVTIPESVTSIGSSAFMECNSLASITIPSTVTSIGGSAFSGCESLTSVIIPKGVTSIGFGTFRDCVSLTSVAIPSTVATISDYAFIDCKSLASIAIPSTVTSIGKDAFFGCESLTSVTIPESVTSIGGSTFNRCKSLASVTIPHTVTTIDVYAFFGCESIRKLALPNAITKIEENTFNSSGIKVIYIPKETTRIKTDAFNNTSVNYVYYGGSETDKENITILPNNDSLKNATWIYNATGLPECEYDNACDTDCNLCGTTREITHNYNANYNAAGHFEECTICGSIGFGEPHTFDNDCDTNCDCGYVRKVTHSYGKYVYNNDATTKKDGTKTRTCSVCGSKQTVTATGTKLQSTNPFKDVKKSDFYYTPVLWAVNYGITSGTSKTTFSPNEACTRGQIATFLWRAVGQPTPSTSKNPFTDVKKSDYYYKAVLWAVGAGITSGTSKTTFSPNDPCTRGQIATFLWRANGGKKVNASNPFTDVKKSDYYYNAVLWAVKNGITAGTSKTTFEPNSPCTRGQIATFLYRAYN